MIPLFWCFESNPGLAGAFRDLRLPTTGPKSMDRMGRNGLAGWRAGLPRLHHLLTGYAGALHVWSGRQA